MDKSFAIEVCGMGNNITGYPGAFTPVVNEIITKTIHGSKNVLHLFSGASRIGNERVDMERPEATLRQDVMTFVKSDKRNWEFVVLDPPYEIHRKSKIEEYGRTSSVAADVELRRTLEQYFIHHADNLLWLDMCAPLPEGFRRRKLWFFFPGGYHTLRILSWLERYINPLLPPVRRGKRRG